MRILKVTKDDPASNSSIVAGTARHRADADSPAAKIEPENKLWNLLASVENLVVA